MMKTFELSAPRCAADGPHGLPAGPRHRENLQAQLPDPTWYPRGTFTSLSEAKHGFVHIDALSDYDPLAPPWQGSRVIPALSK